MEVGLGIGIKGGGVGVGVRRRVGLGVGVGVGVGAGVGARLQASYVRERIPGHALHEKGLQKQKSVVPLVSSQEERALLVPR